MAGNADVSNRNHWRINASTEVECFRTTGVERTSRWRLGRVGWISAQNNAISVATSSGIKTGCCGDKRFGVGVERLSEDLFDRATLDNLP
jgi:hypothetical protein